MIPSRSDQICALVTRSRIDEGQVPYNKRIPDPPVRWKQGKEMHHNCASTLGKLYFKPYSLFQRNACLSGIMGLSVSTGCLSWEETSTRCVVLRLPQRSLSDSVACLPVDQRSWLCLRKNCRTSGPPPVPGEAALRAGPNDAIFFQIFVSKKMEITVT